MIKLKKISVKENHSHSEYLDNFFQPNIFLLNSEPGWQEDYEYKEWYITASPKSGCERHGTTLS